MQAFKLLGEFWATTRLPMVAVYPDNNSSDLTLVAVLEGEVAGNMPNLKRARDDQRDDGTFVSKHTTIHRGKVTELIHTSTVTLSSTRITITTIEEEVRNLAYGRTLNIAGGQLSIPAKDDKGRPGYRCGSARLAMHRLFCQPNRGIRFDHYQILNRAIWTRDPPPEDFSYICIEEHRAERYRDTDRFDQAVYHAGYPYRIIHKRII